MKRIMFLFVITCLAMGVYALQRKEYVVVAGKSVLGDMEWLNVAELLQKRHKAALIFYLAGSASDDSSLCGDSGETGNVES